LTCHSDIRIAAAVPAGFRPGLDDLIIVPLALTVLLAWVLYRAALFVVLLVSDLVFTLFLWVIALPFLVAAIAGDGAAWLLKHLVVVLRLSGEKRQGWRDRVDRHWSGLRHRISHAGLSGRLAAGQETRLGAGGLSPPGPHRRARLQSQGIPSLPPDEACVGRQQVVALGPHARHRRH
jgi:hypothetical protein